MIEIEFKPPSIKLCECCGTETVTLTRFVLKDGSAHAVYYAQFSRGHETDVVSGLVSLGEWGDSATPEDRLAFPLQLWTSKDNYNVAFVNASDSPWGDVTFMGRLLDREEALKHPWCSEVFHITDHIVADDAEVKAFLDEAFSKKLQ